MKMDMSNREQKWKECCEAEAQQHKLFVESAQSPQRIFSQLDAAIKAMGFDLKPALEKERRTLEKLAIEQMEARPHNQDFDGWEKKS